MASNDDQVVKAQLGTVLTEVERLFGQPQLRDTAVIGIQHIVRTNRLMLETWCERYDLEAENIFLLGKCYSTDPTTADLLRARGIYVHPGSNRFEREMLFSKYFPDEVRHFWNTSRTSLRRRGITKFIVLDDGAWLLDKAKDSGTIRFGIEQTSSGHARLVRRNKQLAFPIVNVARSFCKTELEANVIGQRIAEKVGASLRIRNLPTKCVLIGNGSIGKQIGNSLRAMGIAVAVFDKQRSRTTIPSRELGHQTNTAGVIIGATGNTSCGIPLLEKCKNHLLLASASSGDWEFPADILRGGGCWAESCHEDSEWNGKTLLNSGFPINFDGDYAVADPNQMWLTRALMSIALVQGFFHSSSNALIAINAALDQTLADIWKGWTPQHVS